MTTSLEDIKQGNQLQVDDNESQLVNEILNEMNESDNQPPPPSQGQSAENQINVQSEPNNSVNFLQHQMDPNVDMSNLDLSMASNLQNTKQMEPISQDIEVKEIKDSVLDKVKEPLLVLIISFVLNSPIITSNIYRIMPKMLTNSINGIHLGVKYLGVFIQSVLIALIFMLFKLFVLN